MITIKDGDKNYPPYVEVEIMPGIFPGYWWYEVHHWDTEEKCYVHDYEKDGGCFGFWRVMKKAQIVCSETWSELYDELYDKKKTL